MQVRGFQKTSVWTLGGSVRIWGCLLGALGILGREIGIFGVFQLTDGKPLPPPLPTVLAALCQQSLPPGPKFL